MYRLNSIGILYYFIYLANCNNFGCNFDNLSFGYFIQLAISLMQIYVTSFSKYIRYLSDAGKDRDNKPGTKLETIIGVGGFCDVVG